MPVGLWCYVCLEEDMCCWYLQVMINILPLCSLMQQLTQEQEQDEARGFRHQVGSPIGNSPPGMFTDSLHYISIYCAALPTSIIF